MNDILDDIAEARGPVTALCAEVALKAEGKVSNTMNGWETQTGRRAIRVMELECNKFCSDCFSRYSGEARAYLTARVIWRMECNARWTLIDEFRDGGWHSLSSDKDHDSALAKAVLAVHEREEREKS